MAFPGSRDDIIIFCILACSVSDIPVKQVALGRSPDSLIPTKSLHFLGD